MTCSARTDAGSTHEERPFCWTKVASWSLQDDRPRVAGMHRLVTGRLQHQVELPWLGPLTWQLECPEVTDTCRHTYYPSQGTALWRSPVEKTDVASLYVFWACAAGCGCVKSCIMTAVASLKMLMPV